MFAINLIVAALLSAVKGESDLDKLASTYQNVEQWQKRVKTVRQGILRGAQLWPIPEKTPLRPRIHSTRVYDGYIVENIVFESLPGFFVTGNLYRPLKVITPSPITLCPHGHFEGGRFREDMQQRCATFARMGVVAFSYDMVGWEESTQLNHGDQPVLTLQLWNSIRAIDFLVSLQDTDSKRIAVTGASGGGTQAFLLAAVDDRITVSIPVVMVSSDFYGGCNCESGLPIHQSDDHATNNADIAAMAAPNPQLLISCGDDWTKNTPAHEYPYIRNVYQLFGAEGKVENLHLPEEGHSYGYQKRLGVYRFLAKYFDLSLEAISNPDGSVNELPNIIESREIMAAFNQEYQRPENTLQGQTNIMAILRRAQGL